MEEKKEQYYIGEHPADAFTRIAKEFNKRNPTRTFLNSQGKRIQAPRDMDSNLMAFLPNHTYGYSGPVRRSNE